MEATTDAIETATAIQQMTPKMVPSEHKAYYDWLDLPRSADEALINKMYRRALLKLQAALEVDSDKMREEHSRRINEAYKVLIDKEARRLYDRELNE